jgi:hypothetical protein
MNLLDIMRAQRKGGKPPTLKRRRWNAEQQKRMSKGLCVVCGEQEAQPSSFLCVSCESETTMDDIRTEIKLLRARILKK